MFQDFRAGQAAVFGDVADQEQDGTGLLGETGQVGCAFPHLRDTAGRGLDIRHVHDLNTVYHQNSGFFCLSHLHDPFDTGFGQHLQVFGGQAQPFGAHGDLLQGFLTSHIQSGDAGSQMADGLQQKCTLAGTGMAAHKHGGAFDQAAAQDPIELLHARADAGLLGEADVVQALDLRQTARKPFKAGAASALGIAADATDFANGVPGLASRALALPFGIVCAAFGADIGGFGFGHGVVATFRVGCRIMAAPNPTYAGSITIQGNM